MFDLKRFRKEHKISQKDLAEALDVAQSFISQIENGKNQMPESMLDKLSALYPTIDFTVYKKNDTEKVRAHTINKEAGEFSANKVLETIRHILLTETGELKVNIDSDKQIGTIQHVQGPGKTESVLKTIDELKAKEYESYIPVKLVSTSARAGFAGAYYSDEYLEDLPTVLIEADQEYKGKYLAFEVDGDSMEPEYLKGDVVICREVKRDLWQYKLHIKDWDFVIAHGTKGIMLKEIVDHDVQTGEITCHSINTEEHPDFKLNLREVAYLYNVVEVRRSGRSKRRNR